MRRPFVFAFAALWLAALFAVCAPLALLWPSLAWRNRLSLWAGHLWARGCLWAAGIRVLLRGREHLALRPAIYTFNHTNVLDFFANSYYARRRCLVFGKRELARLPGLGWGWWLGGHPLIAREDPERWRQTFARVEHLVRERGYSVVVAPEGTRSRDGRLGPFKKGPFHLALATRAPVVPVVVHGARDCLRGGVPVPGLLRVEVLPPLDTSAWREETLDEHVAEVRARYLEALGQGCDAEALATAVPPSGGSEGGEGGSGSEGVASEAAPA
ncbi:MAG: 1-acyl-sn-glycerol-3-phosphate acyltransferase [Planctomycetota bacterium]|nr:MAG: 1-acyl-sn-glycerol-3-phosphate acyltransferase [Planctomycetota bacterium]